MPHKEASLPGRAPSFSLRRKTLHRMLNQEAATELSNHEAQKSSTHNNGPFGNGRGRTLRSYLTSRQPHRSQRTRGDDGRRAFLARGSRTPVRHSPRLDAVSQQQIRTVHRSYRNGGLANPAAPPSVKTGRLSKSPTDRGRQWQGG
jgi:hypothetical protein